MVIYGTPARKGPEAELVINFLDTYQPTLPEGLSCSILIEPWLQNSIPDIIIILWDKKVSQNWSENRMALKPIDYKLIHYLFFSGPRSELALKKFFPKNLTKILQRLITAKFIVNHGGSWYLRPMKSLFAVRQIITFEAKISASTKVYNQALLNSRFSSQSNILTKTRSPNQKTIQQAKSTGIGLWLFEQNEPYRLLKAKNQQLPQSYLSWQLNDLVWFYDRGMDNEYQC